MKHFLAKKGLSMTQAQTISNLCTRTAQEIAHMQEWSKEEFVNIYNSL